MGERLRGLAAAGWPITLCTSSRRIDAALSLRAAGLDDLFPDYVTLDDVVATKPDPAPYREAAARLGLPAAACFIIEDSPAGVASAIGAGCHVAAVTTTHPAPALTAAHRVFPATLDALDWLEEALLPSDRHTAG